MAKGEGKGKNNALECCAICGTATCCCLIVLIVLALVGLGIAKIVLGAIYLHDCSLQKLVPIWLIVSGVAPILLGGSGRQDDNDSSSMTGGLICGLIGFVFNIIWLICGSYWVYPTYAKVHSNSYFPCVNTIVPGCSASTCPKVLVDFAFAMVTIDWVFVLLGIVACLFNVHRRFCKTQTS